MVYKLWYLISGGSNSHHRSTSLIEWLVVASKTVQLNSFVELRPESTSGQTAGMTADELTVHVS
jgi:hypothetical protein